MKKFLNLTLLSTALFFSGCVETLELPQLCPKQKYPRLHTLKEDYSPIPEVKITKPIRLPNGRVSVLERELINASNASIQRKVRNKRLEKHNKYYVKQILDYNRKFVKKDTK